MTYKLHRLAAGSYDLLLDGDIIGSFVRVVTAGSEFQGWRAELLDDAPGASRPPPFSDAEHDFASLEEAIDWLGRPLILDEPANS